MKLFLHWRVESSISVDHSKTTPWLGSWKLPSGTLYQNYSFTRELRKAFRKIVAKLLFSPRSWKQHTIAKLLLHRCVGNGLPSLYSKVTPLASWIQSSSKCCGLTGLPLQPICGPQFTSRPWLGHTTVCSTSRVPVHLVTSLSVFCAIDEDVTICHHYAA